MRKYKTNEDLESEKNDRKAARILWFALGMIAGMVIIHFAIELNIKLYN